MKPTTRGPASRRPRKSIKQRGLHGADGKYDPQGGKQDSAALVFIGAEAEFKGFIERRTGTSPDYRIWGYVNHLGQAIHFYRQAETLQYPPARERLEALRLKLGSQDFQDAERGWARASERASDHLRRQVAEIRAHFRSPTPAVRPGVPGRVEIHGSSQSGFINNPTLKVLWNGAQVGTMKSVGGNFAFDIKSDGELKFKHGSDLRRSE